MPVIDIKHASSIERSARVAQIEGLFDLETTASSSFDLTANIDFPDEWNIGLVVGPSGCGKTSFAKSAFGDFSNWQWHESKAIVDGFPDGMPIKQISQFLSSVGFSSPPSWLRPFHALSNGEQFRVNVARTLAEDLPLAVIDEFTSVVDRTVAKVGSAATARATRANNKKLVCVSCHYDVIDWLAPDWIYDPSVNEFSARGALQRPDIELEIRRVKTSAWEMFKKHHYLSGEINKAARCFCAFYEGQPIAFAAVLHFPHASTKLFKRGHRVVCLPDFQGVGIGMAMSDFIGSMVLGIGCRYISQTSHPAMIAARNKSPKWRMTNRPEQRGKAGKTSSIKKWKHSARRKITSFEYHGEALQSDEAHSLWNDEL